MKKLLLGLLLFPNMVLAGEPKFELGVQRIEGVSLAEFGQVPIGAGTVQLQRLSAGLRYKKVVFVKAKVYVAQLFGSDPARFQRTESGALSSLASQKAVAILLHFLRDVDAKTIEKAFREGLEENGWPVADGELKAFLSAVSAGGDSKEGSTILVVADRSAAGGERLNYIGPNGKAALIESKGGLIEKIFSIWLGKVSDSGLENLKKELTGPVTAAP